MPQAVITHRLGFHRRCTRTPAGRYQPIEQTVRQGAYNYVYMYIQPAVQFEIVRFIRQNSELLVDSMECYSLYQEERQLEQGPLVAICH